MISKIGVGGREGALKMGAFEIGTIRKKKNLSS